MALLTSESFQFDPVTNYNVRLSGVNLHYGVLFTPGSNLTVSGLGTFLGTETGTSPSYMFGIKQYLHNASVYLGSNAQTNTSTGWKRVNFAGGNINLTSGTPYYIYIQPNGAATTANYISPRVGSLGTFTTEVPNITDFSATDASTNVYFSTDSGLSFTARNLHPLYNLVLATTPYLLYGQPYDGPRSSTPVPIQVAALSNLGQIISLGSNTYISGVGFPLNIVSATQIPKDDCWVVLRSGDTTYAEIGSWKLVGSETVTTTYTWYDVYGINTYLTSGVNYIFDLKSPNTDSGSPYQIMQQTLTSTAGITGSTANFKAQVSAKASSYTGGSPFTTYGNTDVNFRIYEYIGGYAWSQILADNFTFADNNWKYGSYCKVEVITLTDALTKIANIIKNENVTFADYLNSVLMGGTNYAQALVEYIYFTLPEYGVTSKTLAETLGFVESLTRAIATVKSENIVIPDYISKLPSIMKSDTLTFADSQFNKPIKVPSENLTFSESTRKAETHQIIETLTLLDNLLKLYSTTKADVLVFSDSVDAQLVSYTIKALVETFNIAESAIKTLGVNKAESLGITDSTLKSLSRIFADVMVVGESLSKTVGLRKSESLQISDSRTISIIKQMVEALQLLDSLTAALVEGAEAYTLTLSEEIAISDAFRRIINLGNLLVNEFARIVSDDISDHFDVSRIINDDISNKFGSNFA